MESFLKAEHQIDGTFENAINTALDAWSVGHLTLTEDGAKEMPERAAITKYRQEQLATAGIEAALLEREAKTAIRYRTLPDEEVRPLIQQ
jgi:hypothetical protein